MRKTNLATKGLPMFTALRDKHREQTVPGLMVGGHSLIHIIREGRLKVDPSLAQRILDEADYERQRKSYEFHVNLLADSMRRGQWTSGSQIAFAVFGGRLHLVNGRHRVKAVIKSETTQEFQVLLLPCESEEEVHHLYHQFDVVQRRRSLSEILTSSGVGTELSKAMRNAVYEAVGLLSNKLEAPNYQIDPVKARSVDWRLKAAEPWWETAQLFEAAIDKAPSKLKGKLRSRGVLAVGLATLRYQDEKAADFWVGLALNDGLRVGDPRRTLLNDLINRNLGIGAMNQGVIAAQMAWNYFFQNKPLKHIRVYDDSVIRLLGTPYGTRGR